MKSFARGLILSQRKWSIYIVHHTPPRLSNKTITPSLSFVCVFRSPVRTETHMLNTSISFLSCCVNFKSFTLSGRNCNRWDVSHNNLSLMNSAL